MGETYESVTVETKDQVAQVTLIGPGKGNAMGPAFWSEMPEVFHALDADREVRAIVITGSGKNFSYGLDVPAMGGMFAPLIADGALARPRTDFHTEILRMQKAINAVADCRTPTIAAVQGWCIGGAVDLISAVDIRYASADAKFSVREVKLAIVADMGSLARLPLILSDGHLRELALTGKNIDAARAEKIGLVNDVYDDADQTLAAAHATAAEIAANPPLAVYGIKDVLDQQRTSAVSENLRYVAPGTPRFCRPRTSPKVFPRRSPSARPSSPASRPGDHARWRRQDPCPGRPRRRHGNRRRGPLRNRRAAVDRIWRAARHWYRAGMHPAIQLCIRHHGRVVLNRAIGHGWGNAPTDEADAEKIPVTTDTPFCVYSAAKAITATVVHMLVERGHFALDDRVCEYLPSYTSHGKHRTTIRHVLTHSAGVPFPTGPRPDVRRADDHEYAVERLGELRPLYRPGLVHIYHALTWGPLMREIVYAATGKEIREILATEILDPLGFRWTNFGVAERDVPLVAPSHATGRQLPPVIAAVFRKAIGGTVHEIIPYTNTPFFLSTILPSSNTVSTANELSRFMEILRRGGELDGVRVLSPETLRGAVTECRRLRPDFATGLMPLRWGTGFMLGSAKYGPFGRNAPAAFGHLGLVNIAVWADPERALSGGLISSGKPGRDPEAGRYGALLNAITAEIPRASSG